MDAVSLRVMQAAAASDGVPAGLVSYRKTMWDAVWTGDQFIAGGVNTVLTSPDGSFWTVNVTPNPSNSPIRGVGGSATTLVVVGDNGTIYTAPASRPDLWEERISGVSTQLRSVAWSGGQFVVVGASGVILTSPDGFTWTSRTSGVTSAINDVIWVGTQFVAVGEPGLVLTSVDGVTWVSRTSNVPTASLRGITSSGSLIVAVGGVTNASRSIITSTDGVSWTTVTVPAKASALEAVVWTGARFVAMDLSGDTLYSSGGFTWTVGSANPFGGFTNMRGLAASGSKVVSVGSQSVLATSSDGITFTEFNQINSQMGLASVAWGASKFVAVGSTGEGSSSTDGLTWSNVFTIDPAGWQRYAILWSGTIFVATGRFGTIQTSTNGTTWTTRVTTTGQDLFSLAWSGSIFVAVGGDEAGFIRSSPTGTTWTTRTSNSTDILRSVTWGGEAFVAVGDGGKIVTSPDGITWTARTSGTTDGFSGTAYGAGKYVAATSGFESSVATVFSSLDGVSWSPLYAFGAAVRIRDIVWTGSVFLALCDSEIPTLGTDRGAAIYSSDDGAVWSLVPGTLDAISRSVTLNGAASNGSIYVAVGSISGLGATIYRSPRPPTPPYPTV